MADYDTIIIGAGHNGLTAAAYLALAGQHVLILEARHVVGGSAVTETIAPGYRADLLHHDAGLLRPEIIAELNLAAHGLRLSLPDPVTFAPLPDGTYLALWRDPARTADEIARLAPADAHQYAAYHRRLTDSSQTLAAALAEAPSLEQFGRPELITYAMRVASLSCYEWLSPYFNHPAVQGLLAAPGITGLCQGPRSGGTTHVLLYHHLGATPGAPATAQVMGGIGQLSQALLNAAASSGATLRTQTRVARILLSQGRVQGVQLADGETVTASRVLSGVDPHQTFLRLLDPFDLPPSFVRSIRRLKFRGATARLHLALSGLPAFTALPGGDPAYWQGRIQISPSLDYIERAYDAAKYGGLPAEPYLDVRLPSLTDPSLAPPGGHVMSVWMQYAPYNLRDGAWETSRDRLTDIILATLGRYMPDLRHHIVGQRLITPADMATDFDLTEGALYHGEMMLDQQFYMRPAPGWARYTTPIPGLFVGGGGAHPGGGITGMPGRLAARAILATA